MKEKYWEGMEEYPVPEAEGIRDYIQGLAREIDEAFGDMEDKYHPAHLGVDNGLKLYALLREKKPSVVVETGVCNGMSSAVILKALEDNDHGRLYSVDLPVTAGSKEGRTGAVLPPGRSSGWVIPDELRGRWELFTGNTYYELPGVFQKVRGADIFIHDSGHEYGTMMFEFGIAWYHLREGGFLLADNADFNDAFTDFARAKDRVIYRLNRLSLMEK